MFEFLVGCHFVGLVLGAIPKTHSLILVAVMALTGAGLRRLVLGGNIFPPPFLRGVLKSLLIW